MNARVMCHFDPVAEKLCKGRLHAQDLVGMAGSKVVVVMVVVVVVVVVSIPHMYVKFYGHTT